MEQLLKQGLINLSALGVLLYPDKSRAIAASKLQSKINRKHGQSLSDAEREQIIKIVHDFSVKLFMSSVKSHRVTEIMKETGCGFEGAKRRAEIEGIKKSVTEANDKPRKAYKDNPRKQIDQLENNKYL